jgi:hypothetical protein
MAIRDGLDAVDPIVRGYNKGRVIDPAVYGPYAAVAMARANKEAPVFDAPGHEHYDKDSTEIHMWFFGLLLCEYVAGILEKKAREGNCQYHRKAPDFIRCAPAGKLQRDMLEEFGKTLGRLVEEIGKKVADLKHDFPGD